MTDFVGYRPEKPIDVMIEDPAAVANGIAYPFLDRPVIVLWTSPPEAESDIGEYGDWMELVVTHEMAHIVHLTRPRNQPGFLSRAPPAPDRPGALELSALARGRVRDARRGRADRLGPAPLELPGDGAAPVRGRGEAPVVRLSLFDVGWLGGSMAYLVGSAYLEWLEAREGKGSLQKLWKRMASRRGGSFGTAFRAVFGRSPADLYDRFRAEVTASAIEEEKRLEGAGLSEGDLWQRLEGGTVSPQVSPDGSRILARRDPRRQESFLAVWTVEETDEERRAGGAPREARGGASQGRERGPGQGRRAAAHASRNGGCRASNGFSAQNPRWMPDGKRVLFARRAPDAQGVLRWDLSLWEPETGRVSRVTRAADIVGADPAPDGTWAAGVRSRYGITDLVRVDLAAGTVEPMSETPPDPDRWPVWNHPRVSPDGRTVAALLHREGRWRLVLVSERGEIREAAAPGFPVGPPAWSADGSRIFVATDASGIWNIVSVGVNAATEGATLTRVTGGAFSPASSPDGKSLFFLELTARGVDLRRLSLPAKPLAASEPDPARTGSPILPPASLHLAPVGSPRPYSALQTQVLRLASGFTAGPDGNSFQLGIEGSDVVGRLRWEALGAAGNAAGPRGGSIAGAWLGLPAELRLQIFSALEKPGSQHLVPRPELDEERVGGFATASWGRPFSWGGVRLEAGGGWTRVDPQDKQADFDRALGSVLARANFRRTRGESGVALDFDLAGSFGRTAGASWSQVIAGARLSGITSVATLAFARERRRHGRLAHALRSLRARRRAVRDPAPRPRPKPHRQPRAARGGPAGRTLRGLPRGALSHRLARSFSTPSGCAPGTPERRNRTGFAWRESSCAWNV